MNGRFLFFVRPKGGGEEREEGPKEGNLTEGVVEHNANATSTPSKQVRMDIPETDLTAFSW